MRGGTHEINLSRDSNHLVIRSGPEPGVHRSRRDRVSEQRHRGTAVVLRTLVMRGQVSLAPGSQSLPTSHSSPRWTINGCCSDTMTGRHFPATRFPDRAGTKRGQQYVSIVEDSAGGNRLFYYRGFAGSRLVWDGKRNSAAPRERFEFRKDGTYELTVRYSYEQDGQWQGGKMVDSSSCLPKPWLAAQIFALALSFTCPSCISTEYSTASQLCCLRISLVFFLTNATKESRSPETFSPDFFLASTRILYRN